MRNLFLFLVVFLGVIYSNADRTSTAQDKPAEKSKDRIGLQFSLEPDQRTVGEWRIGDTGEFAQKGYLYRVLRIDGKEDMVVRPGIEKNDGEKMWGTARVIKGVATEGLKAGKNCELKGTFKIVSVRKSKSGTAFLVWELQK